MKSFKIPKLEIFIAFKQKSFKKTEVHLLDGIGKGRGIPGVHTSTKPTARCGPNRFNENERSMSDEGTKGLKPKR